MSNAINNRRAGMSIMGSLLAIGAGVGLGPILRPPEPRVMYGPEGNMRPSPGRKHKPAGAKLARHAREGRLGMSRRGY